MQQFWIVYAWLFSFFSVVGHLSFLVGYPPGITNALTTQTDILQSAVTLFGLVPLFLFAYRKRFLNPAFWKVFFFLFVFLELKDIKFIVQGITYGPYLFLGVLFTLPSYLAIFLYAFRFFKNSETQHGILTRGEPKKEGSYVCIYTTNNEHEAQLIKIGLEGRGRIEVILNRKSDAEAPNSFIHQLELYVSEKDKDKAIELLSKFRH